MKRTALYLFIALIALVIFASATDKKSSETKTSSLQIEGMTCSGCVKAVKTSLEKVKGVSDIKVSLADNSALVTFNAATVNENTLVNAVNSTGFKVIKVEPALTNKNKTGSGDCCNSKRPAQAKTGKQI